jgi:non-ribosomal peptide synthetase component F
MAYADAHGETLILQVLFQYMPTGTGSSTTGSFGGIPTTATKHAARLSQAKMDLFVTVGASVTLEYMAELFDEATVARLLSSYVHLLQLAVASPDSPAMRSNLLATNEQQEVALISVGPLRPDYASAPLLHDAFATHAAAQPSAACLVFKGATLSYAAVDARSHTLACHLAGLGVVEGTAVGIMLDRSFELVIAILAVFRAGGEAAWAGAVFGWGPCSLVCSAHLLCPAPQAATCPATRPTPTTGCKCTWRTAGLL